LLEAIKDQQQEIEDFNKKPHPLGHVRDVL
jgi:hypothetical protein